MNLFFLFGGGGRGVNLGCFISGGLSSAFCKGPFFCPGGFSGEVWQRALAGGGYGRGGVGMAVGG